MAISLSAYVKAQLPADAEYVADCELQAKEMVEQYISDNGRSDKGVPESVKARAVLEVGADLFYRRQSRNGVAGLDGSDLGVVRIARDPMRAAYDMLNPYLRPALA